MCLEYFVDIYICKYVFYRGQQRRIAILVKYGTKKKRQTLSGEGRLCIMITFLNMFVLLNNKVIFCEMDILT